MAESDRTIGAMARAEIVLRGILKGFEPSIVVPRILVEGETDDYELIEIEGQDLETVVKKAIDGLEGAMSPAEAALEQARFAALDRAEEVARTAVLKEGTDVRCQIGDLIFAIRSETWDGLRPDWNRIAQRWIVVGEGLEEMTALAKEVEATLTDSGPEGITKAATLGRLIAGWLLSKDLRQIDVNDPDGLKEIEG